MGDHAVVIGGGVAGLLAARVAADFYSSVTVLDRDVLPDAAAPRKAVPQGHHIHALLARGQQILEALFPGFTDELAGLGVPIGDFGTSLSWYVDGAMLQKAKTELVCVAAGRPLLERHIRARLLDLPNVRIRQATEVTTLLGNAGGNRVTGVRLYDKSATAAQQDLAADLVIEAAGRGSRLTRWLEELGYPCVTEQTVKMDLTYTTCDFHLTPEFDPIGNDIALIPVATPANPRGAIFARLPDRYAISLTGILGDRPGKDFESFLNFVQSLPVPEILSVGDDG